MNMSEQQHYIDETGKRLLQHHRVFRQSGPPPCEEGRGFVTVNKLPEFVIAVVVAYRVMTRR